MYDHRRQYRCTIIRSKSQRKMDNLLPLYANIIEAICPCKSNEFVKAFNDAFCLAVSSEPTKKTLDNHRTEIAGQLFGMYYTSEDGIVYPSERTKKFLSDSDTPAFFKDLCYKMQFPNGCQKIQTVKERVANKINIRQFPFLLKVMMMARCKYDLGNIISRKRFYLDWSIHYANISKDMLFDTSVEALGVKIESTPSIKMDDDKTVSKVEVGDEGEKYVYEYEKRRVTEFNFRLAGKVIHLGKTRGLGYDIQSVVATPGDDEEYVKYIEVKATKRVTAPDIKDKSWIDTINMTRNEWVASQQHGDFYSIFRVYFVRDAVIMFVLRNIARKQIDGTIQVIPITYRIDFGKNAVDEVIHQKGAAGNA